MNSLPAPLDGIIATIENLAVQDLRRGQGPLVCVFDQRLLGKGNGALGKGKEHELYSVSIIASTALFQKEGRISERDVLTRHEVTADDLFRTIELLGGGSVALRSSLLLMFDCRNVNIATLSKSVERIRSGFDRIDLIAISSLHDGLLSDVPYRHWMREQNIALAAAGINAIFSCEEGRCWENFHPSSADEMTFATALGQAFKGSAVSPNRQAERVFVFRADLSARTEHDLRLRQPFISILTRFHGKRFHTLRDVFCCLSAQECMDFEHIILAHNLDEAKRAQLDELIASQPGEYHDKIRVVAVEGGNRTRPLNVGFEEALGTYVAILDDDDIVFANWVETYRLLALEKPGRLLRAMTVRQEYEEVHILGALSSRAVSGMLSDYGHRFDHLAHLDGNHTPPVSTAFPRYLFTELGHGFNENLTTTEDWEYISRGASILGIASSDTITSIYRWWINAYSSRTEHAPAEWKDNHQQILNLIGNRSYIFSNDEIEELRRQEKNYRTLKDGVPWLEKQLCDTQEALGSTQDALGSTQEALGSTQEALGSTQEALRRAEDSIVKAFLPLERRGLFGVSTGFAYRRRAALVQASGLFDKDWYLARYTDVAGSGVDALTHFVKNGSRELRSPGPNFDARFYFLNNRDVREKRIEPLFHYLEHGVREGRRPVP